MKDTRIQKALADMGLCSRRQAEQIILEGRVKLNGHPVKLGDKMDMHEDVLSVDGRTIRPPKKKEYKYYMLHKPRGYITTSSDDRGRKTVMELIKDIPERVYPVGRLDKDSEGLLLFTNDGALANALTHPSHQVAKMYRVTVHPAATEEQVVALANGVVLDDGTKTLPAIIRVVAEDEDRTVMEMSIKEGKNRQIRRMCEYFGYKVITLKRVRVMNIHLGELKEGTWREITGNELEELKNALKGQKFYNE